MSLAHRIDVRPQTLRPVRADYVTAKAAENKRALLVRHGFEALFTQHFDELRDAREQAIAKGAQALVAVCYGGIARFQEIHVAPGKTPGAFVIGNSPRAHVSIPSRQLGERHALVQLSVRGQESRVRCIGLGGNLIDVEGQAPVRDVRSSGEMFVRLADVAMMVFPVGRAAAWPESAAAAWRGLPVRVVRGGQLSRIAVADNLTVLAVARHTTAIELGRGAAHNPLVTQLTGTDGADVSRIHAIIVRDASGYVLHDAGSRHGTFIDGERVTTARLPSRCAIRLGEETTLNWRSEP